MQFVSLMMTAARVKQTLVACFVTYDDHHNAAKQYSLHGRIWSEREALYEANKMVAEFIED